MPGYLHIIDAHSIAYRCMYAPLPNLTAPDGEPTKMTFGYVRMMDQLARAFPHPLKYCAVCIDASKPKLLKKKIDPTYKEGRAAFDPAIHKQLQRVKEITKLMGFCTVCEDGYEADDAIATIVKQFKRSPKLDGIVIVTCDKDMMQLMSKKHNVRIWHPFERRFLKTADVIAKWGVKPSKVIEVMTLCGDPTDNVKGIPGVGPKTAAKWINQHGTAQAAIAALSLAKNAKLTAAVARTNLSNVRYMMKLLTECPVPLSLKDYAMPANIMTTEVKCLLTKLGFGAYVKRDK